MLTGSLLSYTRRGGRIHPRLLDPAQQRPREAAEAALGLFAAHRGRRRGELEQALREAEPPAPGGKPFRGLAKILLDAATFEAPETVDPPALREALFDAAAQCWRDEGAARLDRWRARVVERVGRERGLDPAGVEQNLYADLQENQRLVHIRPFTPEGLVYRYNVAQIQGLLLRAESLVLRSPPLPARRLRQLFRYLRFFGLLAQVESIGETGVEVVLDGPLSLLQHSNRYGLNLAQFFPVLLHWEGEWQLHATITPRAGAAKATLALAPHPLLKSHYPDQGQWIPEELKRFQQGFAALNGPWRVEPAERILALPGNRCLVPDLQFTRREPPGLVYLEYLPYPVPKKARQRLDAVRARGGHDYLVACRAAPGLQSLGEEHPALFTFRRTLLPGAVRERLDAISP